MKNVVSTVIGGAIVACSVTVAAQWPKFQEAGVPRDAQGRVNANAPPPRTNDGKPDLSGMWMRADRDRFGGRGGRGAGAGGAAAPEGRGAAAGQAAPQGRGGEGGGTGNAGVLSVPQIEPLTEPFPPDPNSPPIATFFELGANITGGLPYTPWAAELRKQRMATNSKDNPDANCMPMGFTQFHMQPQPRKIIQTPKLIVIEYEANYGLRHIYMDGRKLPPQGEPQPWWYGYSVGRWEGDTLVVETNNLRGAESSPWDGWLDVNGSPYSEQAKFTERFRRPLYGKLEIDVTVEDPKAYSKPFTVRINQRVMVDEEPIEFICNENQQFRRRIKID
jgi:hypothetical protein